VEDLPDSEAPVGGPTIRVAAIAGGVALAAAMLLIAAVRNGPESDAEPSPAAAKPAKNAPPDPRARAWTPEPDLRTFGLR
jgi:hypothetical protein